MSTNSIAILFSGGTDSTLVAALSQEKFDTIYLFSYYRSGIHSIENAKHHAEKLQARFPNKRFIHLIESIEDHFKELSYQHYFKNLIKHNFFMLSTCGFCKLAMHVKSIELCLKHGISHVADGAHHSMDIFPFQRAEVLADLKALYLHYNIGYSNPVFDIPEVEQPTFYQLKIEPLLGKRPKPFPKDTVSYRLFEYGITEQPGIRGTDYDKKSQASCSQLLLFRIFALGFYIPLFGHDKYTRKSADLFRQKFEDVKHYLTSKIG